MGVASACRPRASQGDLSLDENVADCPNPPPAVEGHGGKHGLHTPTSEMHSLVRAVNASMRGGPEGVRLVSTEAKDGGEYGGEVHVALNPDEEHRSSFKKLDPSSYPNSAVGTVYEGFGQYGL